jgi:predicted AAA+ superfamily ATPase
MTNKNYRTGRRIEYKTRDYLKEHGRGYFVYRTAGSHGEVDIIATSRAHVRFIQVKYGKRPTKADREKAREVQIPNSATLEIWYWKPHSSDPEIEIIKALGVDFDEKWLELMK